jgi:hypothetical protein
MGHFTSELRRGENRGWPEPSTTHSHRDAERRLAVSRDGGHQSGQDDFGSKAALQRSIGFDHTVMERRQRIASDDPGLIPDPPNLPIEP